MWNQIPKLLIVTIAALVYSSVAHSTVDIILNGTLYRYEASPRLTSVLAPIATEKDWYWPASKVFEVNRPEVREDYYNVIAQLDELFKDARGDSSAIASLRSIKSQLDNWFLGKRLMRRIDFDRSRLFLEDSPSFPQGVYRMFLTERPTDIEVFGSVSKPVNLVHRSGFTVADYVAAANPLKKSDSDWAYLVTLSGNVEKVGIAYWNRDFRPIEPGSAIYIPITETNFLPSIAAFNQAVAELAVNRMPK